jgi:transketolase C-terminal domain/subunit
LTILDGDLAECGGFSAIHNHPQFFQMGISEQDMVSCAGVILCFIVFIDLNTSLIAYS